MAQQVVTLPDSLINAIRVVCADTDTDPGAAVEAALLITYGYALYRAADSIEPTSIVIPKAQWLQIAEMLVSGRGPAVDRANLGLTWMNLGPSSADAYRSGQVPA